MKKKSFQVNNRILGTENFTAYFQEQQQRYTTKIDGSIGKLFIVKVELNLVFVTLYLLNIVWLRRNRIHERILMPVKIKIIEFIGLDLAVMMQFNF